MGYFVKLNEQGIVQEAVSTSGQPEGFMRVVVDQPGDGEIQPPVPVTLYELSNMMLVEGILVSRPKSPQPYSSDGKIIVPPCSEGTTINVFDQTGQEVMATIIAETDDHEETFEFIDPGTYRVEVEAPFPHLPTFAEVVIE